MPPQAGNAAMTAFEPRNAAFSLKAHVAAREGLYAPALGVDPSLIGYTATRLHDGNPVHDVLDGELAVDGRLHLYTCEGLELPLTLTVQERYLRAEHYATHPYVTVTRWNRRTRGQTRNEVTDQEFEGSPSELFKLGAQLFASGWYDEERGAFVDALLIDAPRMLLAISSGKLEYDTKQNAKGQTFVRLSLSSLHRAGCVLWHLRAEDYTKVIAADV